MKKLNDSYMYPPLFVDNVSLSSGAQFYVVPSLVILLNFIASQLPTVQLIVKCHFLIKQDHGFGCLCKPYQLQGWLCFQL